MPWPALVGPALSLASGVFGRRRGRRRGGPPVPVAAAAGPGIGTLVARAVGGAVGLPSGRRRRRAGLTMREMEKISMLAAVLGRTSPAVTIATMRALGGKI